VWHPIESVIALHQLNRILAWVILDGNRNAAPMGQYNQPTVYGVIRGGELLGPHIHSSQHKDKVTFYARCVSAVIE